MRRKDKRLRKIARQQATRVRNTPRKAKERLRKQAFRAARSARAG